MTFKHFNEMQLEFMQACGQPTFTLRSTLESFARGYPNNPLLMSQVSLWKELIHEEVNRELFTNLQYLLHYKLNSASKIEDVVSDIADDIGDSVYVLCGLANSLGIPLHTVYETIHEANMAKAVRQADGSFRVLRRHDGKILKPEGWKPPNIKALLAMHIAETEPYNDTET